MLYGRTSLTEEKKQHFKSMLTQTLNELLLEHKKAPHSKIHLKEDSGDYTDLASLESDNSFNLRIRERNGKLMQKIEDALARLESGTFGLCEQCGEEISEKRLNARPIARLCIKCKEDQEMAERIRGQ